MCVIILFRWSYSLLQFSLSLFYLRYPQHDYGDINIRMMSTFLFSLTQFFFSCFFYSYILWYWLPWIYIQQHWNGPKLFCSFCLLFIYLHQVRSKFLSLRYLLLLILTLFFFSYHHFPYDFLKNDWICPLSVLKSIWSFPMDFNADKSSSVDVSIIFQKVLVAC